MSDTLSLIAVFDRYAALIRSAISIRSAARTIDRKDRCGVLCANASARHAADAVTQKEDICRGWFERCLERISDDRARTYARLRWGLLLSPAEIMEEMDISATTAGRIRSIVISFEGEMMYPLRCLSDALAEPFPPPPGGQDGTEIAAA